MLTKDDRTICPLFRRCNFSWCMCVTSSLLTGIKHLLKGDCILKCANNVRETAALSHLTALQSEFLYYVQLIGIWEDALHCCFRGQGKGWLNMRAFWVTLIPLPASPPSVNLTLVKSSPPHRGIWVCYLYTALVTFFDYLFLMSVSFGHNKEMYRKFSPPVATPVKTAGSHRTGNTPETKRVFSSLD